MAKLGEIATVQSGGTPARSKKEYWQDGCIPWVKISDIKDKYVKTTEEKITEQGLNNSSAKIFSAGTILYTIFATLGETAVLDIDAATNQAIVGIMVTDKRVLPEFLYYYLVSQKENVVKMGRGVAQNNINMALLRDFEVPIFEQKKQKMVIRNLERLDNLILLRKQQLAKLDELIKARFVEMFGEPISNPFGFKVESLQEMLDDNAITYHLDGNHGSDYPRNEEFVESGVSYISANCIIDDNVNFKLAKHLTEERAAKLRKGIAQDEDVLFAHNATVGPVAILHTHETKVVLGTSLTAYRCNRQRILPSYLKAYMQSEGFARQYTKDMKQTTRNQVPITAQRKYLFVVPPLSLQNEFAAFVERVDQQKQTVQQSLEKLELMKKALMQEYFG